MKKTIKGYIAGFVTAAILLTSVNVFAAGVEETLNVVLNKINIAINGNIVGNAGENYTLDNGQNVPYSILYNGTTYLPMRKVAELVGKDVSWNNETNTAGINNKDLKLDNYANALYIKGEIRTLYTGVEYATIVDNKVVSYDKKFDDAYFLKMNGKYSNMGNNFIYSGVIFELYPEFKDEIINDIQYFEVTKYNDKLYLGIVAVYRFFMEKNIEFRIDDINDMESILNIETIE